MAGRPKKPKTERRAGDVRIRVTEQEREQLHQGAKARALDFSSWARTILLAAAREGK